MCHFAKGTLGSNALIAVGERKSYIQQHGPELGSAQARIRLRGIHLTLFDRIGRDCQNDEGSGFGTNPGPKRDTPRCDSNNNSGASRSAGSFPASCNLGS